MTRETPDATLQGGEDHDQAAARWLMREDRHVSPQRELFAQWLTDNPLNQKAWERAQGLWGAFDGAEENELVAALARAARRAGPDPGQLPAWARLAAACLIVVAVGGVATVGLFNNWRIPTGRNNSPATVAVAALDGVGTPDYVTGPGQKSSIELPDGSLVTLDADSAIDVAFANARRDVRLIRGHAFFDVTHNRSRPFRVEVAQRVVTAIGTQFDVKLARDAVRIVLAEGKVSVASAKNGPPVPLRILAPGQVFAAQTGAAGVVSAVNLVSELSWKQSVLEFTNAPLSDVIASLNRFTRAKIVIKDRRVAEMHVTGVFRTGDVGQFGRSIRQILPVKLVARDANTFELLAAGR